MNRHHADNGTGGWRELADGLHGLRAEPPATVLGAPAVVEDLLPATDGLRWRGDGTRVVIRPSGTEPKLKCYLEAVGAPGVAAAEGRRRQREVLARLRERMGAALGLD